MHNVVIEFGGFYGSIHDTLCTSAMESHYMDDTGEVTPEFDDINWKDVYQKYSTCYVAMFADWIIQETHNKVQIKLTDVNLVSPREYNFDTDHITANISGDDRKVLIDYFKKDSDFKTYLKSATQSVSGFHSYYTYDDAMNDKNFILPQYIFKYLATKYNDEELEYDFDRCHIYDKLA